MLILPTILGTATCQNEDGALPSHAQRRLPDSFVAFTQEELAIDAWNKPVRAPVSPGSTATPETMSSDSPSIVSVEEDGSLVAHRNGLAIVRGVGTGAQLRVLVAQIGSLRLHLPTPFLAPGESLLARAIADSSVELPATSVRWSVDEPAIAMVSPRGVLTARAPGRGELIGSYAGREARAMFEVTERRVPQFTVWPAHPQLVVGSVLSLEALSAEGPVDARWTSSAPRVVVALGGSLFRAVQPGEAEVCASANARRSCTTLEVRR